MEDSITIELWFRPQVGAALPSGQGATYYSGDVAEGIGNVLCFTTKADKVYQGDVGYGIYGPGVHLYSNHLYFEDTVKYQIEEAFNDAKGFVLPYYEILEVNASTPNPLAKASAAPTSETVTYFDKVIHHLPVSNNRVNKVIFCDRIKKRDIYVAGSANPTSLVPNFSVPYFGQYALESFHKMNEFNVRVNNLLVYPELIGENTAYLTSEIEGLYGTPLNLASALYSRDASTNKIPGVTGRPYYQVGSSTLCADYKLYGGPVTATQPTDPSGEYTRIDKAFAGAQHFKGFTLGSRAAPGLDDGVYVNARPIEVLRTFYVTSEDNFGVIDSTYYVHVIKMFGLKAGRAEITI
jgi:hypothetical protein